jgi:DNA repair exonuclease SbcCD ATPase subunit
MDIFSELLDLDYWLTHSKHASNTAAELEGEKENLSSSITRISATVAEIKRSIEIEKRESRIFSKQNKREYGKLKSKIEELIAEKKRLRECLNLAKRHLVTIEGNIGVLHKKLDGKLSKKDEYRDEYVEFHSKIVEARTKLEGIKAQRIGLKKAKGPCPTCGQDISKSHRDLELKRLSDRKQELAKLVLKLQQKRGLVKRRQISTDEAIAELRSRISEQESVDGTLQEVKDTERDLYRTQENIKTCTLDLKTLKNTRNVYKERVQESKARVTEFRTSLTKKKKELQQLESLVNQVKYWVRGFKDIRLFEIGEALSALEVEINSYLADLGMIKWTVHLDIERETKSGGTNRNFHVIVDPGDDSSRPKPWEAWSGGEGQRLRLAGTLALANLILKRHNRNSNLQVWDEPMTWLSGSGREDMLDLLRETAIREGKQIWIVDHTELNFPFDGEIKVIKNKEGSYITQ